MASSNTSTKDLQEENAKLNNHLKELDRRIYELEDFYLANTPFGNVSIGFEMKIL